MKTSASFNFIPHIAVEMIFEYILFSILGFRLPWKPINFRGLDKNNTFGRGQLTEHFCKTFVKISAVR